MAVELYKSAFISFGFFGNAQDLLRNQRFRLGLRRILPIFNQSMQLFFYIYLPTAVTLSERSESNGSNLCRAIYANEIILHIINNHYHALRSTPNSTNEVRLSRCTGINPRGVADWLKQSARASFLTNWSS